MRPSATALIELHYLPSLAFFALFYQCGTVMIEQMENYQKGSFRNRCSIVGANGPLQLSIPLRKGKNQQQPVREVQIANELPWQRQHWQSIRSCYGRAPYFEHLQDLLHPHYHRPARFLFDFNHSLLLSLLAFLNPPATLTATAQYLAPHPAKIADYRATITPNQLTQKPLTESYPQVFQEKFGFIPQLSIIDLLFCTGPEASLYLSRLQAKTTQTDE